jgi:hypothetical protein
MVIVPIVSRSYHSAFGKMGGEQFSLVWIVNLDKKGTIPEVVPANDNTVP